MPAFVRPHSYRAVGQPWHEGAVDERLVDAEPVPAVRRVPRVCALLAANVSKGVAPAGALEAVDPARLAAVEPGHLLVDHRAPGVRVAEHQRRPLSPPLGTAMTESRKSHFLPVTRFGTCMAPMAKRQGRRHRGEEPAPGLARRPASPHGAKRPPRGQQEAVGARRRRVAGGELVDEAEIRQGSPQGRAGRRPLNSESATTSGAPAVELGGEGLAAPAAPGADVPPDDAHGGSLLDFPGAPEWTRLRSADHTGHTCHWRNG